MKRSLAILSCIALSALASVASVEVSTDRTDALYRCGETAVFSVVVTAEAALVKTGEVAVTLDDFGTNVLKRLVFRLSETNEVVITGTRTDPGFLRLKVDGAGGKAVWGVGYEPDRIRPITPVPDDFDIFWTEARRKLAADVPSDARMTKVPERCTDAFDYYRLSFATYGRRVHGYMSVPTDKSDAPFPVELSVSAAGFGDWTNDMKGAPDRIKVFFGVYPFEPDWRWKALGLKAKYDAMNASYNSRYGFSGYRHAGVAVSREDFFFYPVILGLDRAIDWLAARSDVDPRRIGYQGTSQGGGLGLVLTGLNKHITRAVFYVPALTDTLAGLAGRQSGWPSPLEGFDDAVQKETVRRVMPYFDGASFATRITCPVRFAVGLSDVTCPPHCTWAAYNAVASMDKHLFYGIGMGHGCRSAFYSGLGQWLMGPHEPLSVTLTFDDNIRDYVTLVSPRLVRYGWKGVFNLVTDWVVTRPHQLTWNDVRVLRDAGHEIANHSVSHPNFDRLLAADDTNEVRRQVIEARDTFARELGCPPALFCYPGNWADATCRRIVAEAGMASESCDRPNCGERTPPRTDLGAYVQMLKALSDGKSHVVLMNHGVRAGHGWRPYRDIEQFEEHLRELRALESEGFVRITPLQPHSASRVVSGSEQLQPGEAAYRASDAIVVDDPQDADGAGGAGGDLSAGTAHERSLP